MIALCGFDALQASLIGWNVNEPLEHAISVHSPPLHMFATPPNLPKIFALSQTTTPTTQANNTDLHGLQDNIHTITNTAPPRGSFSFSGADHHEA